MNAILKTGLLFAALALSACAGQTAARHSEHKDGCPMMAEMKKKHGAAGEAKMGGMGCMMHGKDSADPSKPVPPPPADDEHSAHHPKE